MEKEFWTAIISFIIGVLLGSQQYYFYKKNLVLTAESHHNEKINGKWYNIYPSERQG